MHELTWSNRLLVAAVALGAASSAQAQPQYFRIVGVPPGDVLNVRERPDAAAPLVATVPPRARRVRGFGCTTDTPTGRSWCRVKAGDAVGWVRETYLRPEG